MSNLKEGRVIAHGMTEAEIADHQLSQQLNEPIEMMDGNGEGDYRLPIVERDMVHIEMEAKLFDKETGKKLSRPKVVKFHSAAYDNMLKKEYFRGYSVRVLHDGKAFLEEERLRVREEREAQRAAKQRLAELARENNENTPPELQASADPNDLEQLDKQAVEDAASANAQEKKPAAKRKSNTKNK